MVAMVTLSFGTIKCHTKLFLDKFQIETQSLAAFTLTLTKAING